MRVALLLERAEASRLATAIHFEEPTITWQHCYDLILSQFEATVDTLEERDRTMMELCLRHDPDNVDLWRVSDGHHGDDSDLSTNSPRVHITSELPSSYIPCPPRSSEPVFVHEDGKVFNGHHRNSASMCPNPFAVLGDTAEFEDSEDFESWPFENDVARSLTASSSGPPLDNPDTIPSLRFTSPVPTNEVDEDEAWALFPCWRHKCFAGTHRN
jgi:hypothetical protein